MKNESTQPQLPPRPTLRATRGTWNDPITDVYLSSEADVFIVALEAENESLKAERDKLLEVVREYRFSSIGHRLCSTDFGYCSTCIQADALLKVAGVQN